MSTSASNLDGALALAALGLRVVPLHSVEAQVCSCSEGCGCKNAGKHPRIDRWLARATGDREQIERWWKSWPDANVGIVPTDGIAVLDIDPRNGGDETLHALEREHGRLPRTVSVKTGGGGQHFYFRATTSLRKITLGDGVELLAEGSCAVAPPSLHASGRHYEWDEHPDEIALADLPDWLYTAARRRSRVQSPQVIEQGLRNTTLTSIAGRMRLGVPYPEAVLPALRSINAERCKPPLPDSELEAIARSAAGWPGLPWLTSPRRFFSDARLDKTARHVLRVLCDCAKHDGEVIASYEQIKRLTAIGSRTTVSRALTALIAAGRIRVKGIVRFGGSPYDSNIYAISRALPGAESQERQQPLVQTVQFLDTESERSGVA